MMGYNSQTLAKASCSKAEIVDHKAELEIDMLSSKLTAATVLTRDVVTDRKPIIQTQNHCSQMPASFVSNEDIHFCHEPFMT